MRLESEAGGTPVLGHRECVISSLVLTEVTGGGLHQYHFKHNEHEEVACPRIRGQEVMRAGIQSRIPEPVLFPCKCCFPDSFRLWTLPLFCVYTIPLDLPSSLVT